MDQGVVGRSDGVEDRGWGVRRQPGFREGKDINRVNRVIGSRGGGRVSDEVDEVSRFVNQRRNRSDRASIEMSKRNRAWRARVCMDITGKKEQQEKKGRVGEWKKERRERLGERWRRKEIGTKFRVWAMDGSMGKKRD